VHAVDQLFPGVADHGELAGVGALIATSLRGDDEAFAAMLTCLRRHELPTSGADLGLTETQLLEALEAAPETRPGRYTILEHLALDETQLRERVRQFTARLP
jgi:glycerol-1-phosphate dehydrogenase [NAD(P)+]